MVDRSRGRGVGGFVDRRVGVWGFVDRRGSRYWVVRILVSRLVMLRAHPVSSKRTMGGRGGGGVVQGRLVFGVKGFRCMDNCVWVVDLGFRTIWCWIFMVWFWHMMVFHRFCMIRRGFRMI